MEKIFNREKVYEGEDMEEIRQRLKSGVEITMRSLTKIKDGIDKLPDEAVKEFLSRTAQFDGFLIDVQEEANKKLENPS